MSLASSYMETCGGWAEGTGGSCRPHPDNAAHALTDRQTGIKTDREIDR